MGLPDPVTGLVIRYAFLWRDEARRGMDEGSKDRPCAILLSVSDDAGDRLSSPEGQAFRRTHLMGF